MVATEKINIKGLNTFSDTKYALATFNVTSPGHTFARQQVEAVRRQKAAKMPAWLKKHRDAYRDRLAAIAQKSCAETGIWFLARGASRDKDEQETLAVWGDLLFFGDLASLPGYSRENHRHAIKFWQSWQNLTTGRLYNPLYQDPQNPEIKRNTPGNRQDYAPDKINIKYVPTILAKLGAELPLPCNTEAHADIGSDTFDRLWKELAQWSPAHAGLFPITAAYQVNEGALDKIPQVEAGMSALVRAFNKETGMWRPEPLKDFPWRDYAPSSGFKVIARLCGYVATENFPENVLKTAINNLLAHKGALYTHPAMARNYGETMAHYIMLTDYRHAELLNAMEECLNGFRDPKVWENTGLSCYCVFGSGMIGAFMNWEDLPFDQALMEWFRFKHGCDLQWRFVVDPYGHWVNMMPKEPEAIFGHPDYDVKKYGLRARNKVHWSKKITDLTPQRDVALKLIADGRTGEGTFAFQLTPDQLAKCKAPYLKATWSGAYDIELNGKPVKQVRYNLPDVPAGWYVPPEAAGTLRAGENTVRAHLIGPGKDQKPDAPLSEAAPFIRLGVIDWQ